MDATPAPMERKADVVIRAKGEPGTAFEVEGMSLPVRGDGSLELRISIPVNDLPQTADPHPADQQLKVSLPRVVTRESRTEPQRSD